MYSSGGGGDGGLVAKLCLTLVTPRTVAHQAPLSMGFPSQEYWSGLPIPPPRDLPNLRIEPASLRSPALTGRFFTTSKELVGVCNLITSIRLHLSGK